MAILYEQAVGAGSLRQGEVIGPLWEHRAVYPPSAMLGGTYVGVESIPHPLVVALSPDCDLLQDYDIRFDADPDSVRPDLDMDQHPAVVTHVLLCDLFSYDEIRPRFEGLAEVWRRLQGNQDECYHHLDASQVGEEPTLFLNDLYIDFKKGIQPSLWPGVRGIAK
jgi:hypothetical protein